MHDPFPFRKLAQVIPFNFSLDMVHPMGVHRFGKRTIRAKVPFRFQLNGDVRSLLYFILFHALNVLGTLLSCIIGMDKSKGYYDAATTLRLTGIDLQANAVHIGYPTPASCESFMHENVQCVLSGAIVKLPTQFVLHYVPSRLESACVLVKPSVGHTKRLL